MLYGQSLFPASRWLGRGTTGPGMAIALSCRACLLELVKYPELRKPAALYKGASHVRNRIVMAYAMVYINISGCPQAPRPVVRALGE